MRPTKQVIVIRRDLKMRRGKEVAQGAHAAMQFILMAVENRFDTPNALGHPSVRYTKAEDDWFASSFKKICVRCNSDEELMAIHEKAVAAGVKSHLITDSGLTEFGGVPTHTCLALGPDYDENIDPITGDLELM